MGLGPYQRSELGSPKRILWRASQMTPWLVVLGLLESIIRTGSIYKPLKVETCSGTVQTMNYDTSLAFRVSTHYVTLHLVKRWAIPLADEARLVNLENATTIGFGSIWWLTFEPKNRNLLENIKIAVNILARSLCGTSLAVQNSSIGLNVCPSLCYH